MNDKNIYKIQKLLALVIMGIIIYSPVYAYRFVVLPLLWHAMIAAGISIFGVAIVLLRNRSEIGMVVAQEGPPEDLTLVDADILLHGKVTTRGEIATLFDLIRRGYVGLSREAIEDPMFVAMSGVRPTQIVWHLLRVDELLSDYERSLIGLVFRGKDKYCLYPYPIVNETVEDSEKHEQLHTEMNLRALSECPLLVSDLGRLRKTKLYLPLLLPLCALILPEILIGAGLGMMLFFLAYAVMPQKNMLTREGENKRNQLLGYQVYLKKVELPRLSFFSKSEKWEPSDPIDEKLPFTMVCDERLLWELDFALFGKGKKERLGNPSLETLETDI